jgi:hypothetical protein
MKQDDGGAHSTRNEWGGDLEHEKRGIGEKRKGSERNTLTADISCDNIAVYDISSSAVMDGDILDWKIEIGGKDEWK